LFTEIKGDIDQTLLFYGHYDKQPPFTGWMEGVGATNPKIIDNKLYGRGGADDGYSTYSTMLALKGLQEQGVKLPRLVMLTEGDEESGSGHMNHYLQTLKAKIGEPFAFFCLDSGALDYDRMWLSTSLRGHFVATLKVSANLGGIHSGTYSGVFPSCYRIARMLINRL
jgi:acetylornithine deacetylase/succinyl-diaminopimelate desuccinylase-like protein